MVEESEHYRRVQVRESQCGQRAVVPLLNKPKQKSEGVAIAGDGTRTGTSLGDQPLAKKSCSRDAKVGEAVADLMA